MTESRDYPATVPLLARLFSPGSLPCSLLFVVFSRPTDQVFPSSYHRDFPPHACAAVPLGLALAHSCPFVHLSVIEEDFVLSPMGHSMV